MLSFLAACLLTYQTFDAIQTEIRMLSLVDYAARCKILAAKKPHLAGLHADSRVFLAPTVWQDQSRAEIIPENGGEPLDRIAS